MDWGHLLFGFSGRINRGKYWLWVLLYFIAAVVVGAVAYVAYVSNAPVTSEIIQFAFTIAALVSSFAVMTKRLHDRDKSAWWLLIFVLVPSVLIGIGEGAAIYGGVTGGGRDMSMIGPVGALIFSMVAAAAVLIWAFVELGCLRGTIGANRFGPDPLEGKLRADLR